MILKMNRKSKGKKGVVEYLLNERENLGTAITLRGNPQITQALIQSIVRKHKYLSGGLMFSKDEFIDDEQKEEIMDAFEEVLFAGIDANKYNILWVEHHDKDRLELNFVVPRIELVSGNDLDLYTHRRDLPLFDMWKNGINVKYQLADPNDPRRARTMSERTKVARGTGSIVTNRKSLDEMLHTLVQDGQIRSRAQMIEVLEKSGYQITRKNEESISIKHPDIGKKALRLKGGIYSETFTSTGGIESLSEERKRRIEAHDNKVVRGETRTDRSTYQKYLQTRADRHKKRYLRPEPTHKKESQDFEKRDTNDVLAKTYTEDQRGLNYDRIREHIETNRRRRAARLAKTREREVKLFEQIKISNKRLSESIGNSEQKLSFFVGESRKRMEANIRRDAERIDVEIGIRESKTRTPTERIQDLFGEAYERITSIAKSIKGVANELRKTRLFKKASEYVSMERPTIKRTPWS